MTSSCLMPPWRNIYSHHLQDVFDHLGVHGLKLHPRKYRFFQSQVGNLGYMIYARGLGIQKAKVEAISKVPRPIDHVSWLRAFLGLANYYWKFVKGFSWITTPSIVESWLFILVKLVKNSPIWTCQKDHSIILDNSILICPFVIWMVFFYWQSMDHWINHFD